MTPRVRMLVQLGFAAALGTAFAFARLAYTCRDAMSEQCVWGKAYAPIALPLEALLVGAVLFAVLRSVMNRRSSS